MFTLLCRTNSFTATTTRRVVSTRLHSSSTPPHTPQSISSSLDNLTSDMCKILDKINQTSSQTPNNNPETIKQHLKKLKIKENSYSSEMISEQEQNRVPSLTLASKFNKAQTLRSQIEDFVAVIDDCAVALEMIDDPTTSEEEVRSYEYDIYDRNSNSLAIADIAPPPRELPAPDANPTNDEGVEACFSLRRQVRLHVHCQNINICWGRRNGGL